MHLVIAAWGILFEKSCCPPPQKQFEVPIWLITLKFVSSPICHPCRHHFRHSKCFYLNQWETFDWIFYQLHNEIFKLSSWKTGNLSISSSRHVYILRLIRNTMEKGGLIRFRGPWKFKIFSITQIICILGIRKMDNCNTLPTIP